MRRAAVSLLIAAGIVAAQTPSFEVASIKLRTGEITMSADPVIRGTRVIGTAVTLQDLLTYAYDVRYDHLAPLPGWAKSDHYDINAKAPGEIPPTPAQARQMMQALLADRFHLVVHRESKELPVYALVVAKGGHKLTASTADAKGPNGTIGGSRGMKMEITRGTMDQLARQLSHTAGRPVVDRTGLTGFWSYKWEWVPVAGAPDAPSDAPSMFTAIQEQLGLRLESSKAPFDLLVVDRAERPSDN